MAAFFGATLKSGIDIVIEATKLRERLTGADLCLTGEGRLDEQSLHGKAIHGVARAAQAAGVPCIAICGSIADGMEKIGVEGLAAMFPILEKSITLDDSMQNASHLIATKTADVIRRLRLATPRGN
jgi:glycerate kinase